MPRSTSSRRTISMKGSNPQIRFEESTHTYWLDGVRVPSITQALKCATYDDFDHVHPDVLAKKAREGTELAAMIEDYVKGRFDVMKYDPVLLGDFDAFEIWHRKTGGKILHSEMIVASRRWQYAGRLDLVYMFPSGDLSMIDIKRTYSPPASGGPQTAAQALAFSEMQDNKNLANMPRYLLHIRDEVCTLVPQKNKDDIKVFLAALNVTKWRMKHGKHL